MHHLFWGHCVKIGGDHFGPRYFSEGSQRPKKNTEVQNNHRRIHTMTETKMVQSLIVINNRYFDNFVCFMCIFWHKHEENSMFYYFCTHLCKWISISPDVTIIARCDKCTNTGCVACDCLCVYAYARMALVIMPKSHPEVIIKSHCYVMTAQFFAPNW